MSGRSPDTDARHLTIRAAATLTGLGAGRLSASDCRVVIVGASGWMGMATVEALHALLGSAFADRVFCFGSNARDLHLREGLKVSQQGIERLSDLPPAPSIVLHMAFLTQEKAKAMSASAYVAANRAISSTVFNALEGMGARAVFLPSSGAVYTENDAAAEPSKRLYGDIKREDEAQLTRWSAGGERRAVIARVFNLSGPYINKHATYALSAFIQDVLARRSIAIRAARRTYRSYVAVDELMSVVFGALTDGDKGAVVFDTAGDAVYEMAEIATKVDFSLGLSLGVQRPDVSQEDADVYVGDGSRYRMLRDVFQVHPVDFESQICRTAAFLNAEKCCDVVLNS